MNSERLDYEQAWDFRLVLSQASLDLRFLRGAHKKLEIPRRIA